MVFISCVTFASSVEILLILELKTDRFSELTIEIQLDTAKRNTNLGSIEKVNLLWLQNNRFSICKDRAPAIHRSHKRFTILVKEIFVTLVEGSL